MTNKQKKQINNIIQATLKIVGCSILFIGMTMALGINVNPHMELTAYMLLFVGTLMIMKLFKTFALKGRRRKVRDM